MKLHFLKIVLASLLILSASLSAFAQPSTQSILKIGTKHGVNLSKINFDPPVEQDITLGYTGGLVIQYMSEYHSGLQLEFNYSQRGWTEKLDSSRSYNRRLTYLEMPVLTHFTFGKKKTQVFLNLGPNLSYHIGDKETYKLSGSDTMHYYHLKLDKDFEFGLVGGIGISRKTSLGDFQLEFRFHYGFQNIFSTNIITDLAKSQNQLYGITLTYFFLKKDFRAIKTD